MKKTLLTLSIITLGLFFFSSANAQEAPAKEAAAPDTIKPKGPPSPEKVFENLDADKDGKLSLEETKKATKGKLAENFEKVDTNADGFVDMEELKAYRAAKRKGQEE